MDLAHIWQWAKIKGIHVVATGDFTHPKWLRQIKEQLQPAEPGLFKLKKKYQPQTFITTNSSEPRFMLVTEISTIYTKNNRVRKIHSLVFMPSLEAVEKFNAQLSWIGNLKSDGRPILGLDVKELLKISLGASPESMLVPAHIWTPWFSLFGSRSGFDSLEEAFEDLSSRVYAAETGLSSDPPMNWRLSTLDRLTLISNSDAHSPRKLGREANILEAELSYKSIIETIKKGDPKTFLTTIEFFPQEGKYHYDGHRNCGIVFSPAESRNNKGICPKCGKPLTLGVMYRVEQLADRPEGFQPPNRPQYISLIPLEEIVADTLGQHPGTKAVESEYQRLIEIFGNEFSLLLDIPLSQIQQQSNATLAKAIKKVREKRLKIVPGYDGVFGKIKIFDNTEKQEPFSQKSLF